MLALTLMLLAGTSAASAGGPHTDSDMGGVGGAAGSAGDFDPYDDELADSVGEWLDKWDGPIDFDYRILRDIPGITPGGGEFGPDTPGPGGGGGEDDDEQTECEKDPDSRACKSEMCDALDDELDEAHEDWYELTDEEREASEAKRDWYKSNCLNTP